MVIGHVFSEPIPLAPMAGHVTFLQALHAGIARQLAPLDDVALTGTGESSAELLGVPAMVLADKLASHFLREIVVRGAGGGPLEPLASQLNHDVTHLQGQRATGMLERVLDILEPGEAARLFARLADRPGLLPSDDAVAKVVVCAGICRWRSA
jgi:hypothetical protein